MVISTLVWAMAVRGVTHLEMVKTVQRCWAKSCASMLIWSLKQEIIVYLWIILMLVTVWVIKRRFSPMVFVIHFVLVSICRLEGFGLEMWGKTCKKKST